MDQPNVQRPTPWRELSREFRRIAEELYQLPDDLPAPRAFNVWIQPGGASGDEAIAGVDAVGIGLLGKPGEPMEMHAGEYHYKAYGKRGLIDVKVFRGLEAGRAARLIAARQLEAKELELAGLRAEIAHLRAAAVTRAQGLDFSREPDDPTPTSPARVPMHVGGVGEGGQVVTETDPGSGVDHHECEDPVTCTRRGPQQMPEPVRGD